MNWPKYVCLVPSARVKSCVHDGHSLSGVTRMCVRWSAGVKICVHGRKLSRVTHVRVSGGLLM